MQDVIKKLRFKGEAVVINAPAGLDNAFAQMGYQTTFGKTPSVNTLVFINNNTEFLDFLNKQLKHVAPDSLLWFAYPKGSSKIKTDINRDTIRATGETFELATVTAISIDDTWSALRFRPVDRVGK